MLESLGNVQGLMSAGAFASDGRTVAHESFGPRSIAHPLTRRGGVSTAAENWETYPASLLWRASECMARSLVNYPRGSLPTELQYVEFERGFIARSVGEAGAVVAVCGPDARIALVQVGLRVALFRLEHYLERRALGEWNEPVSTAKGEASEQSWQTNFAS